MPTVVMVVENVLRASGSGGGIAEGVALFRGLTYACRLFLMSYEWEAPELDRWLFVNGLSGHIGFRRLPSSSPADRIDVLSKISSWSPALVVESDPECAALELANGYAVCLLAQPVYGELRWRPDAPRGPQPWDDVVAELERQEELRYNDTRLKEQT